MSQTTDNLGLPIRRPAPDLNTQLESLFDCVWRAESDERLLDRILLGAEVAS